MKNILLVMALVGSSMAAADSLTIVHPGHWTDLPNCGGQMAVFCSDVVSSSNESNQSCKIKFRNNYNCSKANIYSSDATGADHSMMPTKDTFTATTDGNPSYYLDYRLVKHDSYFYNSRTSNYGVYFFDIFMHNEGNSKYDKIEVRFDYVN